MNASVRMVVLRARNVLPRLQQSSQPDRLVLCNAQRGGTRVQELPIGDKIISNNRCSPLDTFSSCGYITIKFIKYELRGTQNLQVPVQLQNSKQV